MTVLPSDMPPFVHPLAVVESNQIGQGSRIWGWTRVQADVIIGDYCNIGEHCFLENGVRVGNHCVIKNGISLWEGTRVGDRAFLGPHAVFSNERFPRSGFRKDFEPIVIDEGASIGAGAVLVPGVIVGRYATVGAGAVVTKPVKAHMLVCGNPARFNGWVCTCGLKLPIEVGSFQTTQTVACSCGRRYTITDKECSLLK